MPYYHHFEPDLSDERPLPLLLGHVTEDLAGLPVDGGKVVGGGGAGGQADINRSLIHSPCVAKIREAQLSREGVFLEPLQQREVQG